MTMHDDHTTDIPPTPADMPADYALIELADEYLAGAAKLNDTDITQADTLRRWAHHAERYARHMPVDALASEASRAFGLLGRANRAIYGTGPQGTDMADMCEAISTALQGSAVPVQDLATVTSKTYMDLALWSAMAAYASRYNEPDAAMLMSQVRDMAFYLSGYPVSPDTHKANVDEAARQAVERDTYIASVRSAFPGVRYVYGETRGLWASDRAEPVSMTTLVIRGEAHVLPSDVADPEGRRIAVTNPRWRPVPLINVMAWLRRRHPEAFGALRAVVVDMASPDGALDPT